VVLKRYSETITLLAQWTPPMTLGFRRSPSKAGETSTGLFVFLNSCCCCCCLLMILGLAAVQVG
jgi:hypothetical protein